VKVNQKLFVNHLVNFYNAKLQIMTIFYLKIIKLFCVKKIMYLGLQKINHNHLEVIDLLIYQFKLFNLIIIIYEAIIKLDRCMNI